MVSRQGRRAAIVLRISPLQTAGQPQVSALHRFPDMPCMTRVYRDNKATVHRSESRNEDRVSSSGQPGCQSIVSQTLCSPIDLHSISLVRALKRHSGQVCTMPWGRWGTVVSWASRSVGVPSCLTSAGKRELVFSYANRSVGVSSCLASFWLAASPHGRALTRALVCPSF